MNAPTEHDDTSKTTPCYAYLNARIMPIARGKIFEIPLTNALAERGIGEVTGGGTLQAKDREIIHCGIDLDLQMNQANVDYVCDFLTKCGAPKGSKLQFGPHAQLQEIPFGRIEGVAVYLNGTDLPDEVYKTSDINVVMETFDRNLGDACAMRGYWRGQRETAFYLYGRSFAEMRSAISRFVSEYPLCSNARIVQIA